MNDRTFRTVLFYALLAVFLSTAAITFRSFLWPTPGLKDYQGKFVAILIVESVASIFAFWRQLNVKFSDPPKIDGSDWTYECIRQGDTYKHGGRCTIVVKKGILGWEFEINGQRLWDATYAEAGWVRRDFQTPYPWENTWGTFTNCDALRYGYSVLKEDKTIHGYGSAKVMKKVEGKVVLMEGHFYQLPPHDPFFGFQRYVRQ